jgi:hypothetical protein
MTLIPTVRASSPHWIELVWTLEGTGKSFASARNYSAAA